MLAQKASAEAQTAHASDMFSQIDSILAATLEVDDYVDLDSLRQVVEHPPFGHEDLRKPLPPPKLEAPPAEPQFVAPPPLSGLSKVFGKQKHAEATAQSYAGWAAQHQQWTQYVHHVLPAKNAKLKQDHAVAQQKREDQLAAAEAEYRTACDERERAVTEANEKLKEFQEALLAGEQEAVTQYVGVVLGNSAYPAAFDVEHDYAFDAEFGELDVAVVVPSPASVPAIKSYRYVAATDEIRETLCSQKEQRDRYNGAIAAVALRTIHEVFESDREGRIKTIALTVQTEAVNPATGLFETFRFVAAAADRDEFSAFNLGGVNPHETLAHMRALVSKNAFGLKQISAARGVR